MVGKRTYVKGLCGIHIGLRMYSCGNLSFSVFAILGFCDCGYTLFFIKNIDLNLKKHLGLQSYPKKHFIRRGNNGITFKDNLSTLPSLEKHQFILYLFILCVDIVSEGDL